MRKRLQIRCPIPKKDELKETIQRLAATDRKSFEEILVFYIRSRVGEVVESQKKIAREELRIERIKQTMLVALSLISGTSRKYVVDGVILAGGGIDLSDEIEGYEFNN